MNNFKFDTTTMMAVMTVVVSTMVIAFTTTAIGIITVNIWYTAIVKEILSVMVTMVEKITKEDKW